MATEADTVTEGASRRGLPEGEDNGAKAEAIVAKRRQRTQNGPS